MSLIEECFQNNERPKKISKSACSARTEYYAADAEFKWAVSKLLFLFKERMLLVSQQEGDGECVYILYSLPFTFRLTLHVLPADPEHPGGFIRYPVMVIYAVSDQGKYGIIST